jgi:hypothetical protein
MQTRLPDAFDRGIERNPTMADIKEGTRTSTTPASTTNHVQPGVEVYDTNVDNTAPNQGSVVTRTPYDYDSADARQVVGPEPTTNWAGIIIGLLVVVALIALLFWLF